MSFMIKIVLHQANEHAKSSQIINYFDIKTKKHRYIIICKIIFEILKNWSVNIFFEIKLHEYISRSKMFGAQHLHHVHKIWTFRIDHKCDLLKFIMFQFDQLYDSNNFETHEQFFYKCCDIDEHIWNFRQQKKLHYVRLNFDSIKTHTQNILINSLQSFFHFQNVQNHLQHLFDNIVKKYVHVHVFMQTGDIQDIAHKYKKIQTKWKFEKHQFHILWWFNNEYVYKNIIQKNQLRSKNERFQIYFNYHFMYRDIKECMFVESIFIFQNIKLEQTQVNNCREFACNMRVLMTIIDDDREYLIFINVSKKWFYHFESEN